MADVSTVTTGFFPTAKEGFTTTASGTVSSGATTVGLNSTSGLTNGQYMVFVIEPLVAAKKQVFTGVVDTSGSQITGVKWTEGSNTSHAAGSTIVDYETATHWALYQKGLLVEHAQDGTHTDITADTLTIATGTTLPAGDIVTADLADSAVTTAKINDGAVTARKLGSNIFSYVEGDDLNPVPTTETDVANSSGTLTLDTDSTVMFIFGARIQMNNSQTTQLFLNIDGTNETRTMYSRQGTTEQRHYTGSQTVVKDMSAGSYTVKLRAVSNQSSATVCYAPYWRAIVISQ